jgi:hypothetical protein
MSIAEQRFQIAELLEDSPSLRDYPAEIRRNAARQMRLSESAPRERCPFAIEEVLDRAWLPPERVHSPGLARRRDPAG